MPIWVFHGAKDTTVPLQESQDMIDALKKAGAAEVKFTVYPEAGHDSWTVTYDNPELFTWLLAHTRKKP
jgi:predicted peptidase